MSDRDFKLIPALSGFKRISGIGKEDGSDADHERLAPDQDLVITEPGYVYIWLSNENETPVEVYFDDFRVEHVKSPVIQTDDYYPFGLTFNNYQRENSLTNQFKYNGKEEQDELELGLLDFESRMYQSDIGRMTSIDDHAFNYYHFSPYAYVLNNPLLFSDPTGMDTVPATKPGFCSDPNSYSGTSTTNSKPFSSKRSTGSWCTNFIEFTW